MSDQDSTPDGGSSRGWPAWKMAVAGLWPAAVLAAYVALVAAPSLAPLIAGLLGLVLRAGA